MKRLLNGKKKQEKKRFNFKITIGVCVMFLSLTLGTGAVLASEGASEKIVRISCGINELLYFDDEGR